MDIMANCILDTEQSQWGQKELDLQDKHDLVKLTLINAECTSFMLEQQIIA